MGYYTDLDNDIGMEHEGEKLAIESIAKNMKKQYEKNKSVKVGQMINCPCCSKQIVKKTYHSQFCSNKRAGNCKDTYHNYTNPRGIGIYN